MKTKVKTKFPCCTKFVVLNSIQGCIISVFTDGWFMGKGPLFLKSAQSLPQHEICTSVSQKFQSGVDVCCSSDTELISKWKVTYLDMCHSPPDTSRRGRSPMNYLIISYWNIREVSITVHLFEVLLYHNALFLGTVLFCTIDKITMFNNKFC